MTVSVKEEHRQSRDLSSYFRPLEGEILHPHTMFGGKVKMDRDDNTLFPMDLPDIGGKSFLYAHTHRNEWVKFTLTWKECSGLYRVWFDYCRRKKRA